MLGLIDSQGTLNTPAFQRLTFSPCLRYWDIWGYPEEDGDKSVSATLVMPDAAVIPR